MRPPPPAAGLQDPQATRAAGGGCDVFFSDCGGGRGLLEKVAKIARRTYRCRQSRCRACCCRGRWCVFDDRRDRTSAMVLRVYVSDLWTSPGLLPHTACMRHKHAHALTPTDVSRLLSQEIQAREIGTPAPRHPVQSQLPRCIPAAVLPPLPVCMLPKPLPDVQCNCVPSRRQDI